VLSVQALISAIGLNMHRWPSEKHFAFWLELCPDPASLGDKCSQPNLARAQPCRRRVAEARPEHEQQPGYPGAFFRRLKARLGPAKAITATAHRLARIVYLLLKYGKHYVDPGAQNYVQPEKISQ